MGWVEVGCGMARDSQEARDDGLWKVRGWLGVGYGLAGEWLEAGWGLVMDWLGNWLEVGWGLATDWMTAECWLANCTEVARTPYLPCFWIKYLL